MSNLTLQTLSWYNCGSYIRGPHTIDFNNPRQLIYVTGANKLTPELGSNDIGKSTFINILYWTLTGKTLRSSRPGSAIEPWDNDESSTGSLVFIKDENTYTLVRGRRPNCLVINDETVTQDQVFTILGLSEEAICHTIIVGQFNELFMNLRPEQQSALFAELLNLDVWVKAVEGCSKRIKSEEANITTHEFNITKLEGGLAEITEQLETTQKSLEEFEFNRKASLKAFKGNKRLHEGGLDELYTWLSSAEIALSELPDITEQEQKLKGIRRDETLTQSNISKIDVIKVGHERELRGIEDKLKEYRETNNVCPACGQPVEQDHINEVISGLSIRKRKLIDAVEAAEQTRRKHQQALKNIQNDISKMEEILGGTREKNQQCNQHYNSCLLQANQKKAEVDQIQKDIDQTTSAVNPYHNIMDDLNSRKHSTESFLSTRKELLTASNKVLGHLKIWLDGFKQIRLNLIDETLDELEITSNKHAARLGLDEWEIGLHTERETKKGDIQHKFTVNIFPPNIDDPVSFDTLGGGVSTRLQLALFFGLSEVLLARSGITPNIEILDEPTRHMSEEGVEDLLESLKERATDTGRAIYFIDHHSLDKGLFNNVVWIEKTKEGSRIT